MVDVWVDVKIMLTYIDESNLIISFQSRPESSASIITKVTILFKVLMYHVMPITFILNLPWRFIMDMELIGKNSKNNSIFKVI